jgi:formylglycine-generating enzyme required for sulfatase activity
MPHHDTCEHPRDGSLMVLVPAGMFLMGLPDDDLLADEHEKPRRLVELPAFWIDVYPVTNALFSRFLDAGGYARQEWWSPEGWQWRARSQTWTPALWGQAGWDAPEQPVAGVSWYEADAYARWAGRRLPTDAEWEKAARGTDGRRYPWGDDWPGPRLANFDGALGRTSPVGLFPDGVSPYGCHDMAGNVNNWTADWYWPAFGRYCAEKDLRHRPVLDDRLREQLGDTSILEKVDRGGGFATPMQFHEVLGCTRKVHWTPPTREPWNGFRTVVDLGTVSGHG